MKKKLTRKQKIEKDAKGGYLVSKYFMKRQYRKRLAAKEGMPPNTPLPILNAPLVDVEEAEN